jgi:hypothetical protein
MSRNDSGSTPMQTTYVVTYTLRGHNEQDVYFREDFPDAESAEAFIRRIDNAAAGRQPYMVTGLFELRAVS